MGDLLKLLNEPTIDGLVAGRILGLGRSATYAALKSSEIPNVRIGHSYRVLSSKLKEMLGLPDQNTNAA
jgi:hypothetical protein